jgi:hypothetical protein
LQHWHVRLVVYGQANRQTEKLVATVHVEIAMVVAKPHFPPRFHADHPHRSLFIERPAA